MQDQSVVKDKGKGHLRVYSSHSSNPNVYMLSSSRYNPIETIIYRRNMIHTIFKHYKSNMQQYILN